MRTTLAEAKASKSGIARALNIAACDSRFVDFVNNAQQRLSEMGRWWGTYRRLYVCLTKACITWPREVAAVEGFKLCDTGIDLLNEWYEFGEAVRSGDDSCGAPSLVDRPNACQFTDIGTTAQIRIYPSVAADAGTKILLQGIDPNGIPIRTLVSGAYVDGEQVTIAAPFVTSSFEFLSPGLLGVQKPVTKGRLNVYAVDPVSGTETKIAVWEPSEVNPTYRRSFMENMPTGCCQPTCGTGLNGCDPAPIPSCTNLVGEAIVRLELVPASVDTDWLFISNVPALAAACRALMHEDRNQKGEAEVEWERAKRILRNELEKYCPGDKVRVNVRPFGSATPRRVFAGFI